MATLYNASLPIGIENHVLFLTNTTTSDYSQNQMKANINRWLFLFAQEIMDSMDDWDFEGEIATADLVVNQQNYAFPSDILKLKRVEIDYDGDGTYYKAERIDVNEMGFGQDTTTLSGRHSKTSPYYATFHNSIYLYPIPDTAVTDGLKIWQLDEITEVSADTDEPGIAEPFHIGLAYGASRDWFERQGNTQMVRQMDKNLKEVIGKMKIHYGSRTIDVPYIMKSLLDSEDYE